MNVPAGDSLVSLLFHGVEQTLMTVFDESSSSSNYSKNGLASQNGAPLARPAFVTYSMLVDEHDQSETHFNLCSFLFRERVYVLYLKL
jgi:hypothetical protein